MKVLLVNGSPHRKGETYMALSLVEKALKEKGRQTMLTLGNNMADLITQTCNPLPI